jgi:hypothetical protein
MILHKDQKINMAEIYLTSCKKNKPLTRHVPAMVCNFQWLLLYQRLLLKKKLNSMV